MVNLDFSGLLYEKFFHQSKFFFEKYFFLGFWIVFHPLSDSKLSFSENNWTLACYGQKVKRRVISGQIFFIKAKFTFFLTLRFFGLLIYLCMSQPVFHSKLLFSESHLKMTNFKWKNFSRADICQTFFIKAKKIFLKNIRFLRF